MARSRHAVRSTCVPDHSHLLAADAQAEVYEARETPSLPYQGAYGCAYGNHPPYYLGQVAASTGTGSPSGVSGVEKEVLAGPVVAYEKYDSPTEGPSANVLYVRNLQTGRTLHVVPTGTPMLTEPPYVGVGSATTIVVKTNGSLAWIVKTIRGPTEYQVHAIDERGSHLLASGTSIEPFSLALAGSTLYWTQARTPFSATLN